jgi:hypothetical protein
MMEDCTYKLPHAEREHAVLIEIPLGVPQISGATVVGRVISESIASSRVDATDRSRL